LGAIFVTKIRLGTAITLMSLTCSGICAKLPEVDAGNENAMRFAETSTTMFPDGLDHDFGKVRSGTQAEHAFRVVNTSNVPLRVISLRYG
jgi:hypothetical protein